MASARESYSSLMLPVKVFPACQKQGKLNGHWCLAFRGSIRGFTRFGPAKGCSASLGLVVTGHGVRVLDLEKESDLIFST